MVPNRPTHHICKTCFRLILLFRVAIFSIGTTYWILFAHWETNSNFTIATVHCTLFQCVTVDFEPSLANRIAQNLFTVKKDARKLKK